MLRLPEQKVLRDEGTAEAIALCRDKVSCSSVVGQKEGESGERGWGDGQSRLTRNLMGGGKAFDMCVACEEKPGEGLKQSVCVSMCELCLPSQAASLRPFPCSHGDPWPVQARHSPRTLLA